MLSQSADILIVGGSRGGGKTGSLLLEALKDSDNKNFRATIFRREIDDLTDIIDQSYNWYSTFGTYNRSKADMTWNFSSGASIKFNYYSDTFEDFKIRMQGKQYAYIGIDETTHMEYNKFKYLITNNRNAFGIRNRIMASCNPDQILGLLNSSIGGSEKTDYH